MTPTLPSMIALLPPLPLTCSIVNSTEVTIINSSLLFCVLILFVNNLKIVHSPISTETRRNIIYSTFNRITPAYHPQRKEDVSFLWRISRSCFQESVIAKLNDKPEKCKQLIIRAKDHAFAALKLDETDCQVHKWSV